MSTVLYRFLDAAMEVRVNPLRLLSLRSVDIMEEEREKLEIIIVLRESVFYF